ncbi:hypothetical protein WDU94_012871 [Cyamophila willieti]
MSTLFDKLFKKTQHDKQRFGMLYESFLKSKRRSRYQREENARIKSKSSLLDKSKFLYDIPDSMIFPNTAEKDETEENADVFLKEFGELLDKDYYLPERVLVQLGLSHLIEKNDTDTKRNKSAVAPQKSTKTITLSNNVFSNEKSSNTHFPGSSGSNNGRTMKNTNQEILEKINSLKRKFNAESGQPLQNGILSPKRNISNQDHSKNRPPSQKPINVSDDLEIVFCETKTNPNPSLKNKSNETSTNNLTKRKKQKKPENSKLNNRLNKILPVTLQNSGNALSTTKIPNTKTPTKRVPSLTGSIQLHSNPSNNITNTNDHRASQSSTSQANTPTKRVPSLTGSIQLHSNSSNNITNTNDHWASQSSTSQANTPTKRVPSLTGSIQLHSNSSNNITNTNDHRASQSSTSQANTPTKRVPSLTGSIQLHSNSSNNITNTNDHRASQSSTSQAKNTVHTAHNKRSISRSKVTVKKSQTIRKTAKKREKRVRANLKVHESYQILEVLLSNHLPSLLNSMIQTQVPIQQTPLPQRSSILHNLKDQSRSLSHNNSEVINHNELTQNQITPLDYNSPTQVPIIIPRNQTLETINTYNNTADPLHVIKTEVVCNQNHQVTHACQNDDVTNAVLYTRTDDPRTSLMTSHNHLNRSELIDSIMDSILNLTNERQKELDTILKTEIGSTQQDDQNDEINCPRGNEHNQENVPSQTNSNETNEGDTSANETRRPLIFLKSPSQLLKDPNTCSTEDVLPQANDGNSSMAETSSISSGSSQTNYTPSSLPSGSNCCNSDNSTNDPSSGTLFAKGDTSSKSNPFARSNKFGVNLSNLFSGETSLVPPVTNIFQTAPQDRDSASFQPDSSDVSEEVRTNATATSRPNVEPSLTSDSQVVQTSNTDSEHLETQNRSETTQSTSQSNVLGAKESQSNCNKKSDHQSVLTKMFEFNAEMMKLLTKQKCQLEQLMKEKSKTCDTCTKVNEVMDDTELSDERKVVRLKIIQRNQRLMRTESQTC